MYFKKQIDAKKRLIENMLRLDKTFKLNENLDNEHNPESIDSETDDYGNIMDNNFIEVELEPNSKDAGIITQAISQGKNAIGASNDENNEYFIKSKFGIRHYDDGDDKPYYKIHIDEVPLMVKRLNQMYEKNNDPDVLKWVEYFNGKESVDETINQVSNRSDFDKYVEFFNQSKDTTGENFGDYELLSKELFADYISPDIELALSHFNTGEEFADYIINKSKEGYLLTPRSRFKSQGEMDDERNYYKTFKEGSEINEKYNGINKNYTHFAALKSDNKIVNSWDYRGYDPEDLKQFKKDYFFNDIKDMDIDPKLVSIYTRKSLEKKGINPFDTNNWFKFNAEGWQDRNELGVNV